LLPHHRRRRVRFVRSRSTAGCQRHSLK
jgi:hypothetical protein